MKTNHSFYASRLYLQDTNLLTISSRDDPDIVISACLPLDSSLSTNNSKKIGDSTHKIILSKTIFHPQGGGQPSDQGFIEIEGERGMRKFEVLFVQNNSEGLVEHFGHNVKDDGPSFTDLCSGDHVIQLVRLTVNSDMRRMHSHLHSVGHMIDAAMKEIGYNERIFKPTKGYHFTDGPYVEYEIIDADTLDHVNSNKNSDRFFEEMACLLQQTLIELVERKIETTVVYVPRCEDERDNITRIVSVAGCECPCGGTHIDNTGEITEKIIISKIKRKRSTIKVNYSLEV